MDIREAKEKLSKLQRKLSAYQHATTMIYYDGVTGAPKDTAANRASALSVLSEEMYILSTGKETAELLEYLDSEKENLTPEENREVYLLLKEIRDMQKIPMDEYVAYQELLVQADDVWHKAKETSDFALFEPILEKIFETEKRFAEYRDPGKDPYDSMLDQFEKGLTKETCDAFFAKLRSGLVPLIKEVGQKEKIDTSILYGNFPEEAQKAFSYVLMETIGLDLGHVGLSTTEHPFTTNIGSHFDERITTHYHEDYFASSMFSVIHEGGHALYDTGSADEYAYTALDCGVSMGIHESQSRFYENIIGRSKAFCTYIFPKACEFFPSLKEHTAEEFYRAVNTVTPSLIRTESDEVTYCLHVMIRYEIEKKVVSGELRVHDIPAEWNRLYKEYLGVDVPDDRQGCLQDSHWSGGSIGYFPSYALGSAYGAQFLSKMKKTVDVDGCIAKGDFAPINSWNRENIWRHGCMYDPDTLLQRVLGEPFDPNCFIEYLRTKMTDIYSL